MADLRTLQPSFNGGIFSPSLHARVDLAKYASGLKQAKNMFVHAHGGISNRPGLRFVSRTNPWYEPENRVKLIPFQFSTQQSYVLEFGHMYIRFYKNGEAIMKNGARYWISSVYKYDEVEDIQFAQEADVMYLAHGNHQLFKLSRLAEDNWQLTHVTFSPSISAPTITSAVPNPSTAGQSGYKPTVYRYCISAVHVVTGEESLPSAPVQCTNDLRILGGKNRISWPSHSTASRYLVYKDDNGAWGYIGGTQGLYFDDENITADLNDAPQMPRNPFGGKGDYPRLVNFIEQRLVLASTINNPQAIYMSQTANYENFGVSQPAKATDAVTFRIKAREVNEIRGMVAMRGMLVLTSGAQWQVSGGTNADAITPSSLKIESQGYRGASWVRPILVGNMALFVQNRGGVVRDFSYQFSEDSFVDRDLTIMARHLFEGRDIKAWAYAQSPHSIIWVVMNDGALLSLTYMKEHDVWGWCEHDSGAKAKFEDVCVVAQGGEDVAYFVVSREVAGVRHSYIERLETRHFSKVEDGFFVDSGLSYRGNVAVDAVSGMEHLEGESVVGLVDGNVVNDLTVLGGKVQLPIAGKVIHLGLPIEAMMETLPLDLGQVQGLGTVQGRMKSINQVTLRVEKTRGIWTGQRDDVRGGRHLVEYKQRQGEAWNEAIKLYTGDIRISCPWDWTSHGSVVVKQFDPLPMTILSVMPDVTIGR